MVFIIRMSVSTQEYINIFRNQQKQVDKTSEMQRFIGDDRQQGTEKKTEKKN